MSFEYSRRKLLQHLATSGFAAGGALALMESASVESALADPAGRKDAKPGLLVEGDEHKVRFDAGKVVEPARTLPVIRETDVLVVGSGPAGICAAVSAARAGCKVTLIERYGHFGGLWSGGLVLYILGHIATTAGGKKNVCQGIGEDILCRLDKLHNGVVNHKPLGYPTVDAEALKYVMVEMVLEEGIDALLHSWAVETIMDGNVCRGVVFESKSGRQAVLAKQIIDATGDGDIFGLAGAPNERRVYQIGLPYRIANLDRGEAERKKKKEKGKRPPRNRGGITPVKGVRWVNMKGPDADGLDVKAISRLELKHRHQIWKQVEKLRKTPGYEDVYLTETAPQLGVRVTRALDGETRLTMDGVLSGKKFDDCLGYGGSWSGDHQAWQVPFGCLLPKKVENLLAAGRCVSAEPYMSDLVRVIPNCWVTGHAAGAAAATAVLKNQIVREVDLDAVRKLLKEQKACLEV